MSWWAGRGLCSLRNVYWGDFKKRDASHAAIEGHSQGGSGVYFAISWNFTWLGFLIVSKEDMFFFPFD